MADEAPPKPATAPEEAPPTKEGGSPGQAPAEDLPPTVGKTPTKKSKLKAFCHFMYNSNDGFMGRKGLSWAKIGLFFIVLYCLFMALFAFLLIAFFQSIHDKPRLTLTHSLLNASPGLGYSPVFDKKVNPDSALIWYSMKDEGWKSYTRQLNSIVELEQEKYSDKFKVEYIDCASKKPNGNERCSPYYKRGNWGPCRPEHNFGYKEGQPCILIRLNRIIDWEPTETDKDQMTKENFKRIDTLSADQLPDEKAVKDHIVISCKGQNEIDQLLIGPFTLYPKPGGTDKPNTGDKTGAEAANTTKETTTTEASTLNTTEAPTVASTRAALGIPNNFFPFTGQKGYLPPFMMLHLESPTVGVLIQIRCTADNRGILVDEKDGLGTVHFEVLIEQ